MKSLSKADCFNGTGDVNNFIANELLIAIKAYTGEKCAQSLASKLEGNAFDVYLCMPVADSKEVAKITEELLKENEKGLVD